MVGAQVDNNEWAVRLSGHVHSQPPAVLPFIRGAPYCAARHGRRIRPTRERPTPASRTTSSHANSGRRPDVTVFLSTEIPSISSVPSLPSAHPPPVTHSFRFFRASTFSLRPPTLKLHAFNCCLCCVTSSILLVSSVASPTL